MLSYQPHSGLRHQVAVGDGRTYVALAHGGLSVAGQTPTTNGTPTVVYSVDHATGQIIESYLFASVGATEPGSPHHPVQPDNHNQPQVVIDSAGHVLVILAGHDSPLTVARSVKPGTLAAGFEMLDIPLGPGRPNSGATYPAIALDGDTLHLVYRSTRGPGANYYALTHVSLDLATRTATEPVIIARTDPRIQWQSGRKHEWYHDLILIDGVLVVTGKPVSGPSGLSRASTDVVLYPALRAVSRDGGKTWGDE